MRKLVPATPLACLAFAGAALACAVPAHAQSAAVAGSGQQQTLDCAGGDAVIRGDNNQVALTGACRSVLLEGSGNRIRAALAGGATITVRGNDDRIAYQLAPGGEPPRVSAAGQDNQVVADAGALPGATTASPSPPLELRAENEQRDVDCGGRDVVVEGRANQYTLRGGCRSLTIRGVGVQVHAEMAPGSRIAIEGNGDQVDWFLHRPGPDPTTSIRGEGSRILQQQRLGSVVTPPSAAPVRPDLAPPLELTGADQSRDTSCAGRDVKLTGSDDTVVLRGGCRSISVEGDNNRVQAEIMPGTRITIIGSKSTVAFAILGDGPDPIVSVNGQGSDAWRIQRLGATSRADASAGVTPTRQGMQVQGGQGAVVSQMPAVPQPLQDNGPPGVPGSPPAGADRLTHSQ